MVNNNQIECLPLLDMNSPQLASFQHKVRQNRGVVSMVLHGYLDDDRPGYSLSRGFEQERDAIIVDALKYQRPIIFAEQELDLPLLPERVHRSAPEQDMGTVYTLETYNGKPDLKGSQRVAGELQAFLRLNGITDIELSGQFAIFERLSTLSRNLTHSEAFFVNWLDTLKEKKGSSIPWLREDLLPTHCIGIMARSLLLAGFNVSLSKALSPNSIVRSDRKKLRTKNHF